MGEDRAIELCAGVGRASDTRAPATRSHSASHAACTAAMKASKSEKPVGRSGSEYPTTTSRPNRVAPSFSATTASLPADMTTWTGTFICQAYWSMPRFNGRGPGAVERCPSG